MGGYGLYVWGSVGVTFGLMLAEILIVRARRRAALANIGNSAGFEHDDAVETTAGEQRNGEAA